MENTKKKPAMLWILLILLLVIIAVLIFVFTQKKGDLPVSVEDTVPVEITAVPTVLPTEDPNFVDPDINDKPPTDPVVNVNVADCHFSYTSSFPQKIFYEELAETEENDVKFYIEANGETYTVFTFILNSREGDIVQILTDPEGNQIPVACTMNALPENLPEEYVGEFYAAQEMVNEVLASAVIR